MYFGIPVGLQLSSHQGLAGAWLGVRLTLHPIERTSHLVYTKTEYIKTEVNGNGNWFELAADQQIWRHLEKKFVK